MTPASTTVSAASGAPAAKRARQRGPLAIYFGRFRAFERQDWLVYAAWVGLMFGLALGSFTFLSIAARIGAPVPEIAYLLPFGAGIFTLAIAVDTIGHRTIYKEVLRGGEALVHHITIFTGVGACVLLMAAYPARATVAALAGIFTGLSFFYSVVDEAMHWRRYLTQRSDLIEMWSHAFILIGHGTMMYGWWRWYLLGYPGVRETLAALAPG